MRVIVVVLFLTMAVYSETILLMTSNGKVERYKSMEKSFSEAIQKDFTRIDIGQMSQIQIKEYLYDNYPDIVYAIGTKAYQYANKYIPEKKIFFSSIVNFKRLKMGKNSFGVSNELHTGMKLTLIKSLLSQTKTLSIIYSSYTQTIFESFKKGSTIIALLQSRAFKNFIPKSSTTDQKPSNPTC